MGTPFNVVNNDVLYTSAKEEIKLNAANKNRLTISGNSMSLKGVNSISTAYFDTGVFLDPTTNIPSIAVPHGSGFVFGTDFCGYLSFQVGTGLSPGTLATISFAAPLTPAYDYMVQITPQYTASLTTDSVFYVTNVYTGDHNEIPYGFCIGSVFAPGNHNFFSFNYLVHLTYSVIVPPS